MKCEDKETRIKVLHKLVDLVLKEDILKERLNNYKNLFENPSLTFKPMKSYLKLYKETLLRLKKYSRARKKMVYYVFNDFTSSIRKY